MASTPLPLTVPSLFLPSFYVCTLRFSGVLPGGSAQKGLSEAGQSCTQPQPTSPSSFLLPSLTSPPFLPFSPHSTIQGLSLH